MQRMSFMCYRVIKGHKRRRVGGVLIRIPWYRWGGNVFQRFSHSLHSSNHKVHSCIMLVRSQSYRLFTSKMVHIHMWFYVGFPVLHVVGSSGCPWQHTHHNYLNWILLLFKNIKNSKELTVSGPKKQDWLDLGVGNGSTVGFCSLKEKKF